MRRPWLRTALGRRRDSDRLSSDISHYLPYGRAKSVDHATVQRILRFDAGLTPHEACGCEAIKRCPARCTPSPPEPVPARDLRNSGRTGGGHDRVVGCTAIAFEACV
ncbi:AmmeMemoRadiSam system protein B [Variovorax sp. J22R133]|uniref:AmmeMemoRadiSam system protein B n=1 Tax=Variovorax brevis TaxID=3053503 RepID=UPI002578869C|nr:AmmeMemoRadiSam system protein B [Variovorax sp. J22R133]MDM0116390.1 AmmeMemoRadiSam system protein B [Variovorax sp. J22R133]